MNPCRIRVNAALTLLIPAVAHAAETTAGHTAAASPFDWPALLMLLAGVVVLSFIFAKLEIQIEGPQGWATGLPTWRVEKHQLLDWFWGGRPMTGYHAWAFTFVGLAFHLPYLFGCPPSWRIEMRILGSLMLFWILEDFLWFVLNPAFGIRRLNRDGVWWHKHWFGPVPVDYVTFTLAGSVLLAYSFMR